MPDSLLVVDASALAALLFGEPRADEIAERLGDARLVVPTLLPYEIASVCAKKIARQPGLERPLLEALSLLERMELRELPVPHHEVVALASRTGLTTYDASYLWLARNLEAELVTLDDDLRRAASRRV